MPKNMTDRQHKYIYRLNFRPCAIICENCGVFHDQNYELIMLKSDKSNVNLLIMFLT